MSGMFGALLGAVLPALVGGLFGKSEQKQQQRAVMAQNKQQRGWENENYTRERLDFFYDRDMEWARQHEVRAGDRMYADRQIKDQRAYEQRVTKSDRAYDQMRLGEQRRYDEGRLAESRRYDDKLTAEQRAYDRKMTVEQRAYNDAQLDAQVDSRGVDFQKLREQAEAAGFNPLTVLGNAGLYSTERGVNLGSYASGGRVSGGGYQPGGGYQSGGGGSMMSGLPAIGGGGVGGVSFSSAGRGFSSAALPAMSSAGFVQEALERGIDTVMNTPPPVDPLAEALRSATQQEEAERVAQSKRPPGSFGYDLTISKPFEAASSAGLPPLSAASAQASNAGMARQTAQATQSRTHYVDGKKWNTAEGWSPASDFEDEYSDIGGNVYGVAHGLVDIGRNLGDGKIGWAVKRLMAGSDGRSQKPPAPKASSGGRARYPGMGRPKLAPPYIPGRDYYGRPLW